jgi:hypothetical protein
MMHNISEGSKLELCEWGNSYKEGSTNSFTLLFHDE